MRTGLVWAALATASLPGIVQAQPAAPAAAPPPPVRSEPARERAVEGVVVTGQAAAVQTSIDRRSYSVTGDLRAQSGAIADALRNVPSVQVDVQGNVSLRGDPNVTILIDGKPSGQFQGESRAQALQQLPADRIERVEVISNPSAEFRADGTAGVINLITKRARGAGETGGFRLTGGTSGQVFASGNYGYNDKALSIAADAFVRIDRQAQRMTEDRERPDPVNGGAVQTDIDAPGVVKPRVFGGRATIDYDLDKDTRVSGELRTQVFDFDLYLNNHTEAVNGAGAPVLRFDRAIQVDQLRGNGEATLSLLRKFEGEGHELKLSLSYEVTEEDRTRSGVTAQALPAPFAGFDRQHVLIGLRQLQAKGDYVRPMESGAKMKAGFDLQWDDNRYDNRGFVGPSAPARAPNPALTNVFEYEQVLSQGYVTYEQRVGDLTVLAGLRLEDVRIDVNQVTQGRKDENDYFRAYPSLHLSWKLTDTQALTASYSHRVQRPQPEEFNAFRFLLDPITFRSGSPDLKPQQTHSFELGWQRRKNGTVLLATAYYRENEDGFTDITRDLGGGVFLISRANFTRTRNGGMEVTATGRLSKAITYNVSGNAYWSELNASEQGFASKRSTVTWSARGNVNWQVTANDLIQLNGFVASRTLLPQGSVAPTGLLNLGWRHKFDDRLSLIVSAQDVLATLNNRVRIDTPSLKDDVRREFQTRVLFVGLAWTFGGGRPRDQGFDFQGGAPPPQ